MSESDTRSQIAEKPENDVVGALERGYRINFSDLLSVLYGSSKDGGADVQHVLMGVLHTNDKNIYKVLGSDDVVRSLAEGAVKNMFFELPKDIDRQRIVGEFLAAADCDNSEANYQAFAKDFQEGDPKKSGDDWIVDSYENAQEDPEKRTIDFISDYIAPLMVKAKCGGIKTYVTDDIEDISKASAILREHKRALKIGDDGEATGLGREFLFMRHSNESLAAFIESKAGDEKSLYFGGILRGLRDNDFEEFLKDESGEQRRAIKIDVAPNYNAYAKDFATYWLKNKIQEDYAPEFGEDPPDLVYLMEEGVCLTTKNTPQYVLDALEKQGIEHKPVEELYGQNTVGEQSLVAQETEDKGLTLSTYV